MKRLITYNDYLRSTDYLVAYFSSSIMICHTHSVWLTTIYSL